LQPLEWQNEASVCVIMASKGYPGKYEKGKWITGLNSPIDHGTMIFHSGTKRDEQNRVVTNGGRVLSVCALGSDTKEAAVKAYSAVEKISWGNNEQHFRTDIGNATLPYQK
jgi:phosphoribosylamine--glycine ligase